MKEDYKIGDKIRLIDPDSHGSWAQEIGKQIMTIKRIIKFKEGMFIDVEENIYMYDADWVEKVAIEFH